MGHLSLLEDHKFLYYFDNFVDDVGVDGHYEHHKHLHGSVRFYEVVNLAGELSVLVLIQVEVGPYLVRVRTLRRQSLASLVFLIEFVFV